MGISASVTTHRRALQMSIRRAGYLYEHMFPPRSSNIFAGLLEVADAMLSPSASEPTLDCDASADRTASNACAAPHPHRRRLTHKRQRRQGPAQQAQICLSPIRPATVRPADADTQPSR